MTEQEKALALYFQFFILDSCDINIPATDGAFICKHIALQCAEIVVNEILYEYKTEVPYGEFYDPTERVEYWEQVLKELESMQ